MFRMKYIGAIVGTLVACGLARAGGDAALGTAGAQELRIPVGARSTALMGANLGDVGGIDAIFWNPGGLTAMGSTEVSFGSYKDWADMTMVQFAAAHKFEDWGAVGIAARVFNTGELIVTTEDMPNGTGETIEPKFSTVTFTWSRQMTDRVSLGANLNLLSEKIKDMSAHGYGLDFGVQVVTPMDGLSFGVVLKNFGPDMRYAGYGGEERTHFDNDEPGAASRVSQPIYQGFELPSSFQTGLSFDALADPMNRMTFYGTFQSNHHSNDEYRFGAEYAFQNSVFLRGGYVQATSLEDEQEYLHSWGAGVGFKVDLGSSNMFFDWSYNPTEFFDASQWYSVRFEF